jgi:frataxin-like iron-binding protein CyaY
VTRVGSSSFGNVKYHRYLGSSAHGHENSNDGASPSLSLVEYHNVVDSTLDEIVDRIYERGLDDRLEPELAVWLNFYVIILNYFVFLVCLLPQSGVLKIQSAEGKSWVINKQTPNQQIWWSSPIRYR